MAKKTQRTRGEQGVPGPPGPAGPRGMTGSEGDRGITGEKGVAGAVGRTGARGEKGDQGSGQAPAGKGRKRFIAAVDKHIENIYSELTVQMKRMARIQLQIDELRNKIRKAL